MEPIKFFLPGPSYVPEDARQAMTAPAIGHRSAPFRAFYATLTTRLARVLRTTGDAMIASGSSTLVMESAVISTVSTDVLSLTCGAFGERWHSIARAVGKSADRVGMPWGEAVDPDLVRAALRRKKYEAVTLVHNETSTGVMSPLAEIARVVREESDALIIVDAVSSLGGAPIETDEWALDIVLAGTQKALAAPPGLAVFNLSDRAAERAAKVERRGFYTDLLRYRDKHREGGAITTPAIPLFYALDKQVERMVGEAGEGMERRWSRHTALQHRTAAWASRSGCEYTAAEAARSPTVSCLRPPAGVDAQWIVKQIAARGYTIGGGYGDWKSSTFRIGHMGEVTERDLDALLADLDDVLAGAAKANATAAAGRPVA